MGVSSSQLLWWLTPFQKERVAVTVLVTVFVFVLACCSDGQHEKGEMEHGVHSTCCQCCHHATGGGTHPLTPLMTKMT